VQLLAYVDKKILYSRIHKGYYVTDGVLCHKDAMMSYRRRLVVPTQLREQVFAKIMMYHLCTGHFLAKKAYDKVSQYFLAGHER